MFACGLGMGVPGVLYHSCLCVGVLENGRKRKLIAVNLSSEEISESIRFAAEELRLDGFVLSGEGSAKLTEPGRLQLGVAGSGMVVLDWEV